jgi:hypothetical protein
MAEMITGLEAYFRSEHRYDLQADAAAARGDRSPIRAFLEDKRAAHCEYFSTASVLLLRALGVPCRLSTGYLVVEFNDETDFYQAINRHAHAWAEAYDQGSGEWLVVESTPGINEYIAQFDLQSSQQARDRALDDAAQDASGLLGWLTRLFNHSFQFLVDLLSSPLGWLQMIGLASLIWTLRSLRARHFRSQASWSRSKHIGKADLLAKSIGFTREPGETCHRFAARLQASLQVEAVELGRWYQEFAAVRYRVTDDPAALPSPPSLRALRDSVRRR